MAVNLYHLLDVKLEFLSIPKYINALTCILGFLKIVYVTNIDFLCKKNCSTTDVGKPNNLFERLVEYCVIDCIEYDNAIVFLILSFSKHLQYKHICIGFSLNFRILYHRNLQRMSLNPRHRMQKYF